MAPAPFNLDLEDFLRGMDRTKSVTIDDVFAVPFDALWAEHHLEVKPKGPVDALPLLRESDVVKGVKYVVCDNGIIAVDTNERKAIGWYMWATLALDPNWQGLGLGRELVIARLTHDGENPVWHQDKPAYSVSGLAAHESAWREMCGT